MQRAELGGDAFRTGAPHGLLDLRLGLFRPLIGDQTRAGNLSADEATNLRRVICRIQQMTAGQPNAAFPMRSQGQSRKV